MSSASWSDIRPPPTLAYLAADRRPSKVAASVLIGGFPTSEGGAYAPKFGPVDGVVAFPGSEGFEGPESADLTEDQRASIAENALAMPASVALGRVHYEHETRHASTPVVEICPEFSPEDALAWIEGGSVDELEPDTWDAYAALLGRTL